MEKPTHCSGCGRELVYNEGSTWSHPGPPLGWINHKVECPRRGKRPDVSKETATQEPKP